MKKVAFHNLGCKVNSYEMDGIEQKFQNEGFEIVNFAQKADIYVINTCSVTNIADRKSRQMIHKARSLNSEALIVAVGCYVQADPQKCNLDPDIDIAVGNNKKADVVQIVKQYCKEESDKLIVEDLSSNPSYEDFILESSNEHTRAFIKIQDGCNQFCSYCIIPFTRGRIRSRSKESIIEEITLLAKKGYKEFVLTGIHLSSYGITEGSYNENAKDGYYNGELIDIIETVSKIPGVGRIRLGSLEPRLITQQFLSALKNVESFCPHFHLSLQSGCDEVLKRMNRHYTTKEFADKVRLIREYFEHPAVTTDIIVGFPMESEEEFNITKEYLNEINLYETHIFKYSRRKGTVADKMKGQLTEAQKSARSSILSEDSDRRKRDFIEYYVGRKFDILTEEVKTEGDAEYLTGYNKEYVRVAVIVDEQIKACDTNCFIRVEGVKITDGILFAKPVKD